MDIVGYAGRPARPFAVEAPRISGTSISPNVQMVSFSVSLTEQVTTTSWTSPIARGDGPEGTRTEQT
jgi:hypothetical protein